MDIEQLANDFHAAVAANADKVSDDKFYQGVIKYVESLETHIAQLEHELDTAQGAVFKVNGQVMLLESELKDLQSLT